MIVLVGGPQDGRQLDGPDPVPPLIRLPRFRSLPLKSYVDVDVPHSSTFEVDEYVLGMTLGHPSRDDAGRIRYLFTRTSS